MSKNYIRSVCSNPSHPWLSAYRQPTPPQGLGSDWNRVCESLLEPGLASAFCSNLRGVILISTDVCHFGSCITCSVFPCLSLHPVLEQYTKFVHWWLIAYARSCRHRTSSFVCVCACVRAYAVCFVQPDFRSVAHHGLGMIYHSLSGMKPHIQGKAIVIFQSCVYP